MLTKQIARKNWVRGRRALRSGLSLSAFAALLLALPSILFPQTSPLTVQPSTGRVGVNRTTPGYTLDVNGTVNATSFLANGSPLSGGPWSTSGTNVYYNGGNVGIGTSTPASKFNINGGMLVSGTSAVNSSGGIRFDYDQPTRDGFIGVYDWTVAQYGALKFNAQDIIFRTSSIEKARFTNAGNLGIGTTTPGYKLDVVGTVNATAFRGDGSQLTNLPTGGSSPWLTSGTSIYYNLGNVGIGTTTPTSRLHVAGGAINVDGAANIQKEANWLGIRGAGASGGSIFVGDSGTGHSVILRSRTADSSSYVQVQKADATLIASFNGDGNVGIGTAAPDFLLHVNGTAGKPGGGSWSNSSDIRLKKDVESAKQVLDRLLQLRGVTFEYKDPDAIHELSGTQIGMIAQEVERVFPQWVDEGADGYKRVTFRGFEALVVEALRELRDEKDAQIAALKARVADFVREQQSQMDDLRAEIESLRGKVKFAGLSEGK